MQVHWPKILSIYLRYSRKNIAISITFCSLFCYVYFLVCPTIKFHNDIIRLGSFNGWTEKYVIQEQRLVKTEKEQLVQTKNQLVKTEKLQLLLHVGPGKTATTSIQKEIISQVKNLEKDNWLIYRCHPARDLNYCLYMDAAKCQDGSEEWKRISNIVRKATDEKMNILISTERYWGNSTINAYKSLFQNFQVKIVVGYRRFYEYLPSSYWQTYKWSCSKKLSTQVALRKLYREKLLIPPLSQFVQHKTNHPTFARLEQFKPYFDDIKIFNIHRSCVLCSFFCDIVQNARNSCKAIRLKYSEIETTRKNVGQSMWHIRLAQQLLMVNKEVDEPNDRLACSSLATEIMLFNDEKLESKVYKLPKTCLPEESQNQLLNISLGMEKTLVPHFFSSDEGEKKHRVEFERASYDTLCDVDIPALFKDTNWNEFFEIHPELQPLPTNAQFSLFAGKIKKQEEFLETQAKS